MRRRPTANLMAVLAAVAVVTACVASCEFEGTTATVSPTKAVEAPSEEPAENAADASSEKSPAVSSAKAPDSSSKNAVADALIGQEPKPRPKLLPGARTKVLAAAGDRPYDKTFDDLRFDIEVGEPFERAMLTDGIKEMSGQRIRIRGYILPTAQRSGIKQFVLVRDNQECCFGPGAALYDCILVEMEGTQTAQYTIRPVAVEGKFDISEIRGPDGKHLAIYRMDAQTVK